ncbi:hypothetical protein TKK_0002775 [Trichogramma kaykai]|uniref:RanBD1 domain-containing protein n=1 Tax=Trichogramma kaykai TaxID=54128 RepID=A0ABD2XSQ2_9HYME
MAGKRQASSDLNADNWDHEEEREEAGVFKKAPEEVLKQRVVRTAKRRITNTGGSESAKSAFSSFSGFNAAPAPTTAANSLFSFLAKTNTESTTTPSVTPTFSTNKLAPTTNGSSKVTENGSTVSPSITTPLTNSFTPKDSKSTEAETQEGTSSKKSPRYYAKLKGLNQSVTKWINQHVDANPVCILTPIFKDYEKYLKEITENYGKETSEEKKPEIKLESKPQEKPQSSLSDTPKFNFGSTASKSTESTSTEKLAFGGANAKSIFSSDNKSENKSPFGSNVGFSMDKSPFMKSPSEAESKKEGGATSSDEKTASTFSQSSTLSTTPSATFSFGQSSTMSSSTGSAGFSFGGGKPFSFGAAAVKPVESEEKKENNEEEDDEPPKPDFKQITEEGSIYDQKCKVFVKKDGNYSDRGVGTLFLKPAPNDKMQLIVRATNSLGNLLLNTLLTESIPIKRLNKTNIMLVCLPLPTSEPPPVATLLRVKTSEDADALFEALEKHKK